jgi:hypothetical protein
MDCENNGGSLWLAIPWAVSLTAQERVCFNFHTVHGQMRWVVVSCNRIWAVASWELHDCKRPKDFSGAAA